MAQYRTPFHERVIVKGIGVLVIGVMVGIVAAVVTDQVSRSYLMTRARTSALAFDAQGIETLKSTLTEETGPYYNKVRAKLAEIRDIEDVRFVYVMAQDANGVYFLADSEPESSEDHSTNGEQYPNPSAELQAIFTKGNTVIEGPVQDDWGTWMSALAPLRDPTTKKVVAVVGLDVPAWQYIALIVVAFSAPILIAVVVATFLLVNHTIRRRRLETLRFRSELVSIASHELRTPLTGIRWAAQTLQRDSLTKPQGILVGSIHNSVLQLEESIDDILQLASINNNAKMQRKPANLRRMFEEIFATQQLPAQQKKVSLVFARSWPKESPTILCDAVRMRRVFSNLVSNAVKYSRESTEVLVDYTQHEGYHEIAITDHGIGIPEQEQNKVFSGFYRASNAVEADIDGTGMGLYLSRAVVEQHGGTLEVRSVENKGTTVVMRLPLA